MEKIGNVLFILGIIGILSLIDVHILMTQGLFIFAFALSFEALLAGIILSNLEE